MNEEEFKERLLEWLNEAVQDQVDSFNSSEGYFDDLAISDVIKQMTKDALNDKDELTKLIRSYAGSFKNNSTYKTVVYQDFGAYKLVSYGFELTPKIGDLIGLTIYTNDGIPKEIEGEVTGKGIASLDSFNIKYTNDCVKYVINED